MALLDNIKQSLTATPQQPVPGQQTASVLRTLQAKTGRASGPLGATTPAPTTIAENIETSQARAEMAAQRQQGVLAATELEQKAAVQQQGFIQQQEELKQRDLSNKLNMSQQLESKLNEFARSSAELTEEQRKHALTQFQDAVVFENEKYLFELQDLGRRKRLDQANNADEELKRAVFKEDYDLLEQNFRFSEMLAADDRTWKEYMTELTGQDAWDLSQSRATAAAKQQQIQGVTGIATAAIEAGASAYGTSEKKDVFYRRTKQDPNSTEGKQAWEDYQTTGGPMSEYSKR